jgi:disulfide bond formation protein DsbB
MERFRLAAAFIQYLSQRKKFWLLPIVLILVFVGIILGLAHGSVVAPFIYTLF